MEEQRKGDAGGGELGQRDPEEDHASQNEVDADQRAHHPDENAGDERIAEDVRYIGLSVLSLDGPDVADRAAVIEWLRAATKHEPDGQTVKAIAFEREAGLLLDALDVDVPSGPIDVALED